MTADEFNKQHPIDTQVTVNIGGDNDIQTETSSNAWTMPSGKHMVNVYGLGGVELSKVTVIAIY